MIFLVPLAFSLFVIAGVFRTLAKRGSYGTAQAIAMADRVFDGGYFFSGGAIDNYGTTGPYLPGTALLALALRHAGFDAHIEETMLFIAAAVLVLYVVLLHRVYLLLDRDADRSDSYRALAIILVGTGIVLSTWTSYAYEFKPDTIALFFGTLCFVLIWREKKSFHHLVLLFIAAFLSLLFKQQYVFFFAGLFLAVAYRRQAAGFYLPVLALAALSAVLFLSQFENIWYFAIEAHRGRAIADLWSVLVIHRRLGGMLLLSLIAAAFVVDWRKAREVIGRFLGRDILLYALPCAVWALMAIRSALNHGGNDGNTAVAIAPALPLAAFFVIRAGKRLQLSVLLAASLLLFSVVYAIYTYKIYQSIRVQEATIQAQINYLKQYAGQRALIDGDAYMIARRSGIIPQSDLYTAHHLEIGRLGSEAATQFYASIAACDYDLVLLAGSTLESRSLDMPRLRVVRDHYAEPHDPAIPGSLADKFFARKPEWCAPRAVSGAGEEQHAVR